MQPNAVQNSILSITFQLGFLFNFRYPAELHIVHYGQKYDNFTEASKHPDGLAVLAVLIEVIVVVRPRSLVRVYFNASILFSI